MRRDVQVGALHCGEEQREVGFIEFIFYFLLLQGRVADPLQVEGAI